MKIKHLAPIIAASAVCAAAPLALAQNSGQSGDNTSGRVGATSESTANRKDQALKPASAPRDGITKFKGKVYVVKDGMVTRPDTRTEVADGVIVEQDMVKKNGQLVDLVEGQMMTFDGNMIEAPKEIQDRAAATSQGPIINR